MVMVVALAIAFITPLQGEITFETIGCICNPEGSQVFSIVADGSAGPFTFHWEGPDGYRSDVRNPDDMVVPGMYTVWVTNAYECSFTFSGLAELCDAITDLSLTATENCVDGGSVESQVTGGTPPYTYAWSNGAATPTINNLSAGEYTLTVTDANGCTLSASATVVETLLFTLTETITPACQPYHRYYGQARR